MPSPDTLATIALVAAAFLAIWLICRTEPGGAVRLLVDHLGGEHPGRRVRPAGTPRTPHAKPLVRHAAPRGFADSTALAVISDPNATIPDGGPFAARTA